MQIAMKPLILIAFFFAAACAEPDTLRQPADSGAAEPAYKVFYENGFYTEAMELLRSKIKEHPESTNIDYLTYIAFCYAASGRPDSASTTFSSILDLDSAFYLDTITTSPKILSTFQNTRSIWRNRHPQSTQPADSVHPAKPLVSIPAQPPVPVVAPKPAPLQRDWYRYALFCLPAGAGQFYNRQPVRGILFLALQAVGAIGGYWALEKRDGVWDAHYGLGESNRPSWEKYSTMAKTGFSVSLTFYAFSIADCIIDNMKHDRGEARR